MDLSATSQNKLKRQALRDAVWLAKLIRYMPYVLCLPLRVQAYVARRLDLLAAFVTHLVVLQASEHCRPGLRQRNRFAVRRAASRHDVRGNRTYSLRATIGGQLRRQLKARGRGSKNLKARAAVILYALQNLDRLVGRFVRRMRKGLSRRMSRRTRVLETRARCVIAAAVPIAALFAAACAAPLADTS